MICHSHFQDSCFVTGPLNLPVIITAARPEILVKEVETGDQNDPAMLDLGELNAVVQQEPPALDHDYHTGASYWDQANTRMLTQFLFNRRKQ